MAEIPVSDSGGVIRTRLLDVVVDIVGSAGALASIRRDWPELVAPLPRSSDPVRPFVLHVADQDDPADVLAALTRLVVDHTPRPAFHAAVVAGADGLVVIPGASGAGKSTLAAALVREGFDYVSDEVLAVNPLDGTAATFARPFSLSSGSWSVLRLPDDMCPVGDSEVLLAPSVFGVVHRGDDRVKHVLIANRSSAVPPALTPCPPHEALHRLLTHSFNHYRDASAAFATATRIAREASLWRVQYDDAASAAREISQRITPAAR